MTRDEALQVVVAGDEWSEHGGAWQADEGEYGWRVREGGFGDGIELRLQVYSPNGTQGLLTHELTTGVSHWHELGEASRRLRSAAAVIDGRTSPCPTRSYAADTLRPDVSLPGEAPGQAEARARWMAAHHHGAGYHEWDACHPVPLDAVRAYIDDEEGGSLGYSDVHALLGEVEYLRAAVARTAGEAGEARSEASALVGACICGGLV